MKKKKTISLNRFNPLKYVTCIRTDSNGSMIHEETETRDKWLASNIY